MIGFLKKKAMLMAQRLNRTVEPEAIDFDGTNDYLSRSSDLVGSADGKTFTFSACIYVGTVDLQRVYTCIDSANNLQFGVYFKNGNYLAVIATDASGSAALDVSATGFNSFPLDTWVHFVVSVDLSDVGKRWFYLNEAQPAVSWSTYTNSAIEFTGTDRVFIGNLITSQHLKGRLAHVFLDYTYRDLSVEANRRLFITEDGKPAKDQESLNPILYLPLDDYEAPGVNLGTGGDFALNGVVAQSGRGPNQWNCVASEFDGTANQFLSQPFNPNVDVNAFSLSCNCKYIAAGSSTALYPLYIQESTNDDCITLKVDTNDINLVVFNSTRTVALLNISVPIANLTINNITVSCDLSDAANSLRVILNGADVTSSSVITAANGTSFYKSAWVMDRKGYNAIGDVGELYFDTTYIDLATNNPFWDDVAGKPKPVLQVLEETGNTPLIAMPIRADDPGKNYGTGGDFTVNSGPYTGARGASEFWARSVVVDGTNYLSHAGITCASLVKWLSTDGGATWSVSYLNNVTVTDIGNGTDNGVVAYYFGTSESIDWAQEANKLRFTDAFGYPVDPEVDANTVLYLPFDDTSDPGKNLGTEGDFTVTGTVDPGADVDPS